MRRRFLERGAAAIEFALVLPLLLMLVLGGLDWGYYFYVEQIVVNATREGARAGTLPVDPSAGASDAEMTARQYLTSCGLDASRATVSVTASAGSVAVDVVFPTGSLTGFTKIVVPETAHGSAVMRR